MAIPGYLAMTPVRIRAAQRLPRGLAWMSCRFSQEGLRDLPRRMPPGSLLILDDGSPCRDFDRDRVIAQLRDTVRDLDLSGLLLDFQKPHDPSLGDLAKSLAAALPCPVAVSEGYAGDTEGPVFLDLIRPHERIGSRIRPYRGRELWLELSPGAERIRVTEKGTEYLAPNYPLPPCDHADLRLFCHYRLELSENKALFTLVRQKADLLALLREAEDLGVTRYVGLFGELPELL